MQAALLIPAGSSLGIAKRFYRVNCEIRTLCHKLRNSSAKGLTFFFSTAKLMPAENSRETGGGLLG